MATVTDTELSGRSLRVLRSIDAAGNTSWYKLSLWSRAVDTVFADNKTAQAKLGNINGITSDINGTATDIAASIKVVRDVKLRAEAINTSLSNAINSGNTNITNTINSLTSDLSSLSTTLNTVSGVANAAKQLADSNKGEIDALKNSINAVSEVATAAKNQSDSNKNSLGNCNLSYENGKYYIQAGADAGTKKPLGSGLDNINNISSEQFTGNSQLFTSSKDGTYILVSGETHAGSDGTTGDDGPNRTGCWTNVTTTGKIVAARNTYEGSHNSDHHITQSKQIAWLIFAQCDAGQTITVDNATWGHESGNQGRTDGSVLYMSPE